MKIMDYKYNEQLVGKAFEELSPGEMIASQGGANVEAAGITSSVPCASVSSGWCSAGTIVSTIVYSIMKC